MEKIKKAKLTRGKAPAVKQSGVIHVEGFTALGSTEIICSRIAPDHLNIHCDAL